MSLGLEVMWGRREKRARWLKTRCATRAGDPEPVLEQRLSDDDLAQPQL